MSVFEIYIGDGGAKFMRPIHTREAYLKSRDTDRQRQTLKTVREQDATQKNQLTQNFITLNSFCCHFAR